MESAHEKFFFQNYPFVIADSLICLENEVLNGSFTAWSFGNKDYQVSSYYSNEYCVPNSKKMNNPHPIFDLASLTKPLFLNLYLQIIHKQDFIPYILQPISNIEFNDSMISKLIKSNFSSINLLSILNHCTGLNPWTWLGQDSVELMTEYIFTNCKNDNNNELYSDLNYFILARIIENLKINSKISWMEVLENLNENLFTEFFHASIYNQKACIPFYPYKVIEANSLNTRKDFGYVHDTNANIFSSCGDSKNIVSGHSGFTGTVQDISRVIERYQKTSLSKIFNKNKTNIPSRFFIGFDTPSSVDTTAGMKNYNTNKHNVFGHLGYTGTSFWFHAGSDRYQILLTNRTSKRINLSETCNSRFYILEDKNTNQIDYIYIKDENMSIKNLSKENFYDLNFNLYRSKNIIWDDSIIPNYRNLSQIRKKIGLNLWDI